MRDCDALSGTKDQKHQEGGSDDANNDEDESRAGEARSLLRWWNGRFHLRLDAGGGSTGDLGKEVPHGGGYLLEVGFEGEVACVQKLNGGIGVIARIGFCACGMKNGSFLPQIARSGGFDLRKYS